VTASGAFLFGKLPALGDFVCRGMTPAQREAWDARCTAALAGVRDEVLLEATPPHGFLLAPTASEPFWQLGCAAPSCDRAGRHFLLVLGIVSEVGWDGEWCALAARLEPCLRAAITHGLDAEAVFSLIGEALASGEAGEIETMRGWRAGWIGVPAATKERDD
jgi:type VI secretion system protein ImpM